MKNTLKNIQGLRGIAVIAVVLLHLAAIEKKYSTDQLLGAFFHLGSIGVDIFFVISGFIMVSTSYTAHRRAAPMPFLLLRASRIYPLYWLVTLALYAAYCLLPDILSGTQTISAPYILKSLLLLPQETLPLLTVGWTLVFEMFFYGVFTVILALRGQTPLMPLLFWLACTVAGNRYLEPVFIQPWLNLVFNPLTLEFISGCLLALTLSRLSSFPTLAAHALPWLSILGVAAGWQTWRQLSPDGTFPVEWYRVILFLLPALLAVAAAVALEQRQRYLPVWLQKIGDASYSIYLTHVLVLSALGKLWQPLAHIGLFDNLIALPLFFLLTLAAGRLCFHWVERPLLKAARESLQRWLPSTTRTTETSA